MANVTQAKPTRRSVQRPGSTFAALKIYSPKTSEFPAAQAEKSPTFRGITSLGKDEHTKEDTVGGKDGRYEEFGFTEKVFEVVLFAAIFREGL